MHHEESHFYDNFVDQKLSCYQHDVFPLQAVLIEGVVGELLRGPLGEVFDHRQLITGVSGSGNNW